MAPAQETLARRPSHDPGDDGGHAALGCAWLRGRNFFRVHAALQLKNAALDSFRVDMSIRQSGGSDHGEFARHLFPGDAGGLFF